MKLSYEDYGPTSVLTLSGEFTHDKTDTYRRACQDRFEAGVYNMVLDLEHLDLVDSAGLEMLLWTQDEVAMCTGKLRLVQPDDSVQKILEITRLDRRFDIHPNVESAAKSLR